MTNHSIKKHNRKSRKNNRKLGGDFFNDLKQKGLDQIKEQALDKIKSNPSVSSLTKFLPPSVIDKMQPTQPEQPNVIVVDNNKKEEPTQPNVIVVDNKKEEPPQPNVIVLDNNKKEEPPQPNVIVVDNKEELKSDENKDDKTKSLLSKFSDLVKSSSETKSSTDNIKLNGNDYVEGTCLFTGAKGLFPKNNTLTIKKDELDKELLKEEVKDELKKEVKDELKKGGKKTNKTQKKGGKNTNKSKKNSRKNRSKK
jgi:co-chaperonin GroES (HSP10)